MTNGVEMFITSERLILLDTQEKGLPSSQISLLYTDYHGIIESKKVNSLVAGAFFIYFGRVSRE